MVFSRFVFVVFLKFFGSSPLASKRGISLRLGGSREQCRRGRALEGLFGASTPFCVALKGGSLKNDTPTFAAFLGELKDSGEKRAYHDADPLLLPGVLFLQVI